MPVDPMYQQPRMKLACEGCGRPHENASEELTCMRAQLGAARHAIVLTVPKPKPTVQEIERKAAQAYATFATDVWGVAPAHVRDMKSVSPPPATPVSWEQLPGLAKETWRAIARGVLAV